MPGKTNTFLYRIDKKDKKTKARTAIISTPHGEIKTPAFSPVATKASVKTLDIDDLKKTESQVILANTYHLYLQPGIKTIKKFGGFPSFMKWQGPTITDSGGYQVSFLWEPKEERAKTVKVNEDGAIFTSHIDGSRHVLTPELSIKIQHHLGADIIMALDQPLGSGFSEIRKREAFDRTLRWEERSLAAWKSLEVKRKNGSPQALFGIIQGEIDKKLREKSLKFLIKLGFPGLAIGGESIGSNPALTSLALDTILDDLPYDKPLHALGLGGGPEGILEAVERGVDTFDNTSVTRMARTGLVFIYPEDGGKKENKFRLNITKSVYKDSKKPMSKICKCFSCTHYSRAYLNHLFLSHELLGLRLATIHNISFVNNFMGLIRSSIDGNEYSNLKKEWLKT